MDVPTGFIRSIVAEPDEDHHRLVLADWLGRGNDFACPHWPGSTFELPG